MSLAINAGKWLLAGIYWFYLSHLLLVLDPWTESGGAYLIGGPGPDTAATLPSLCLHGSCFFVGTALLLWAAAPKRREWLLALIGLVFFYGALTEWLQTFIPLRFGSVTDLAANVAGAVSAVYALGFGPLLGHGRKREVEGSALTRA